MPALHPVLPSLARFLAGAGPIAGVQFGREFRHAEWRPPDAP